MMNHMTTMSSMLGIRPSFARTIGKAIIPLPIQVPATSSIAPSCLYIIFPFVKKNSYFKAKKKTPLLAGSFEHLFIFYKRQPASRLMGIAKKKKQNEAADFM
jgi:hypothetical protein